MVRRIRERISIFTAKKPSIAILVSIFILNILLIITAAVIISLLSPQRSAETAFWPSVFYTISMVLDAGCISYVIDDIGQASVTLILICISTVLIGMITFTGAMVGYVTNYISSFIDNARSGNRALRVSGHTIILNWNTRASEIINDLLYTGRPEVVVVLASQNALEIEREINERLTATTKSEQLQVKKECAEMPHIGRLIYSYKHRFRNRVTVIVREGETYSTKQLNDISISQAESIILLAKDRVSVANKQNAEPSCRGNANTIKTLVQVAEMTANENSADHQTIIVEVEDSWTAQLVERIIIHKERMAKCHIIPVYVNCILGQILSQFSIMPELNTVYSELFSNRGAEFFFEPHAWENNVAEAIGAYMHNHRHAIPLTIMQTASGNHAYYVADSIMDCELVTPRYENDIQFKLNPYYTIMPKNIVIIGHNSKCEDIMRGFSAFRGEHKLRDKEILNITVIDSGDSLNRLNNYSDYPYVAKTIAADVYDASSIKKELKAAITSHNDDTSILILSDDNTPAEDIDSAALTYLIYVQDVILNLQSNNPRFRRDSVDVIVEILNPKNYDVVHNYSADNVVISNRYISKMVTQIGRKQALFEFYSDILTYDAENSDHYESKELYIKDVERFFAAGEIPPRCTARDLVLGVYNASPEGNKTIVIGLTHINGEQIIFSGDQSEIEVELKSTDKLIVFSNH